MNLLGLPAVSYDGTERLVDRGRASALLAILAMNPNQVVSAGQLISRLWITPTDTARQGLHNTVTRLRRTLGSQSGRLVTHGSAGYQLNIDRDDVDTARFRRHIDEGVLALRAGDPAAAVQHCTAALDLWHGDPLAGVPDAPWKITEVRRLEELRHTGVLTHAEASTELARYTSAISDLRWLTHENPLNVRGYEQLMKALARDGQPNAALNVFHSGRRALDEGGLEPSAVMRDLQASILRNMPVLALTSAALTARSATGANPRGTRREARSGNGPQAGGPSAARHRRMQARPAGRLPGGSPFRSDPPAPSGQGGQIADVELIPVVIGDEMEGRSPGR